ncbi:MAG TPA: hypothetical protein VFP72_20265 [Kineosporiaceae bacterium]|nr:hypothetical protein [Kineosporiaceae bacterium]
MFGLAGVYALVMALRGEPSMARSRWEGAFNLLFFLLIVAWPATHPALPTIERLSRLSFGGGMAFWVAVDMVRRWRQLPQTVQKSGGEKPVSDVNRS